MEVSAVQSNVSSMDLYTFLSARAFYVIMTSTSCCVFLIINGTILFTLRSKPMFWECPRYVLLFNLVLADTVLLAQAQVLYLLAAFLIRLSYPLCGCITMISYLTFQISPFTLTLMSLERYVAVCFPFRHPTIVTLRHTGIAIAVIWLIGCLDTLTRVLLLMEFHSYQLLSLQMPIICSIINMSIGPKFKIYEPAYTGALFALSALVIFSSFVGVMIVARSASSDNDSAKKSRNTLLLHMFQLGLNLLAVQNNPLFIAAARVSGAGVKLQAVVYVFVILAPRCLNALTYGLRDPSLRPVLGTHLCFCITLRVGRVKQQKRWFINNRRKCDPHVHLAEKR